MNSLQEKLFTLLQEINTICNENDIEYYLAGGTALGAVRGGKFLPWDDDIDLYITRDNWNKLVDVMNNITLPKNRDFVCIENADYYWNPIGRYVNLDTTLVMKSQVLCGRACGVMVEFLIMDPLPTDEGEAWAHREFMKAYTELLTPFFIVNNLVFTENKDFNYNLYKDYYNRAQREGFPNVIEELKSKFTSFPADKAEKYCMRWGFATLMYDKKDLGKPRLEKFEGAYFPVGEHAEGIFRVAYGDTWMYVPAVSEQIVHNNDSNIDVPFSNYRDIYMPLLDRDYYVNVFMKRKQIGMEYMLERNEMHLEMAKCQAIIASKNISKQNVDYGELEFFLSNKKHEALDDYFDYYYSMQLSKDMKKHHVLIDVDDKYLYYALMNKIMNGQYFAVGNIIKLLREFDAELSERLTNAIAIYDFCQNLSIEIYDHNGVDSVTSLLNSHSDLEHRLVDYDRAKAYLLSQLATNSDELEALKEFANESLSEFPNDGELIRYIGLVEYKKGNLQESKELYEKAVKNTRNGFVWREADELFDIDTITLSSK